MGGKRVFRKKILFVFSGVMMAIDLPAALQDREYQKFEEVNGKVTVRTTSVINGGTITPSGLQRAGKITPVSIDDLSWTPLPATPLMDRNAICIQNYSGVEIKVNYDDAFVLALGYLGIRISNRGERYYDIKDSIVIYARATPGSGTVVVDVEEIS